jgi:hypothetical protein
MEDAAAAYVAKIAFTNKALPITHACIATLITRKNEGF